MEHRQRNIKLDMEVKMIENIVIGFFAVTTFLIFVFTVLQLIALNSLYRVLEKIFLDVSDIQFTNRKIMEE